MPSRSEPRWQQLADGSPWQGKLLLGGGALALRTAVARFNSGHVGVGVEGRGFWFWNQQATLEQVVVAYGMLYEEDARKLADFINAQLGCPLPELGSYDGKDCA